MEREREPTASIAHPLSHQGRQRVEALAHVTPLAIRVHRKPSRAAHHPPSSLSTRTTSETLKPSTRTPLGPCSTTPRSGLSETGFTFTAWKAGGSAYSGCPLLTVSWVAPACLHCLQYSNTSAFIASLKRPLLRSPLQLCLQLRCLLLHVHRLCLLSREARDLVTSSGIRHDGLRRGLTVLQFVRLS